VLADDGIPDPEKIAVRAEQLAEWKPRPGQGRAGAIPLVRAGRRMAVDQGAGVTWAAVLRGHD
jgi:hypothetical protein